MKPGADGAGGNCRLVETFLYFVLGCLCAGLLAALVIPAVWRRAVALTTRQIERSVPLTAEEIRAEQDGLRAEHAKEMRKLELELKASRERAASDSARYARGRKDVKSVSAEREAVKTELAGIESDVRGLRDEVRQRDERIHALSTALAQSEEVLLSRKQELEKLSREFEEVSYASSARQIELIAKEGEIERLSTDLSSFKGEKKNRDRFVREAESRVKLAEAARDGERQRASELNAKVMSLLATLSDREDKLERRDREVGRLKQQLRTPGAEPGRSASLLAAPSANGSARGAAEAHPSLAPLQPAAVEPDATRALRRQMAELAAEVTAMTAAMEGNGTPIDKLLEKPDPSPRSGGEPSLGDRIRKLRDDARRRA